MSGGESNKVSIDKALQQFWQGNASRERHLQPFVACINRHGCEYVVETADDADDDEFEEVFIRSRPVSSLNVLVVKYYLAGYLPEKGSLKADDVCAYVDAVKDLASFFQEQGWWQGEALANAVAYCEAAKEALTRGATATSLLHQLVSSNKELSAAAAGQSPVLEGCFKITRVSDDSIEVVPDDTHVAPLSLPSGHPVSSFQIKMTEAITEQLWQDDCVLLHCVQKGDMWIPVGGGDVYPDGGPSVATPRGGKAPDVEDEEEEVEWDDTAPPAGEPTED